MPKNKLNYGEVDVLTGPLQDRDAKVRITTFIDMEIYNELRKQAQETEGKYQTLLNEYLRRGINLAKDVRKTIEDYETELIQQAVSIAMREEISIVSKKVARVLATLHGAGAQKAR